MGKDREISAEDVHYLDRIRWLEAQNKALWESIHDIEKKIKKLKW